MNDQTPMNTAIAIPQGASLEVLFKAEQDERDRIETERLAKEQAERDLISAEAPQHMRAATSSA